MKKVLLLLILSFTLVQAEPTISPEFKTSLMKAKLKVPSMTAEEVLVLIQKPEVILVDVRNPDEWKSGLIKSTQLVKLSRGFLEIKYPELILKNYSKNDTYIVYCEIEPRSILAASRLKELGFTNVAYLKGGIKNWRKHKYQLSKKE